VAGVDLAEFSLRKASLDEVFLALTGGRADGAPLDGDDLRELDELERCAR